MQIETNIKTNQDSAMMKFGKISEMDRSFDIEYWQNQGDAAILQAAAELIDFYLKSKGVAPDEFRLQRTVERFQRASS